MKLSPKQIAAFAIVGGFPLAVVPTAVAIALAESQGQTGAENHNTNGSNDLGLWQINDKAHAADIKAASIMPGGMSNPINNARAAYRVYREAGNSFSPWVTYNNGAYRQYMSQGTTGEKQAKGSPMQIASDPSLWNATGYDKEVQGLTGPSNGPTIPGVSSAESALSSVGSALGTLTSASTWLRIGAILGAVLLVVVGVVFMVESNKDARHATELAAVA